MHLPKPRGALSEQVLTALRADRPADVLTDLAPDGHDDAALTLWVLYEQHYRGFEDAAPRHEWDPDLLRVRRVLEHELEDRLRAGWRGAHEYEGDFADAFFAYVEGWEGPSLARHVQRDATRDEVIELIKARSIYHLKESDPSAFVVPRLPAGPRAGLMELQYDEYGNGRPERLHAQLFADGLAAMGLESEEGAYVDDAPAVVLEQNNAMSLVALNRRLRGAAMGLLAAFEVTSPGPCRRMARGLERLGFPEEMAAYYLEHVEADAVHEQLATRNICGRLIQTEPATEADVWFGAYVCLRTEDDVAEYYLERWGR